MANTLSEAASIVGVYPDTLGKYLDVEIQSTLEYWVRLNNHKIRRVPVFSPLTAIKEYLLYLLSSSVFTFVLQYLPYNLYYKEGA